MAFMGGGALLHIQTEWHEEWRGNKKEKKKRSQGKFTVRFSCPGALRRGWELLYPLFGKGENQPTASTPGKKKAGQMCRLNHSQKVMKKQSYVRHRDAERE